MVAKINNSQRRLERMKQYIIRDVRNDGVVIAKYMDGHKVLDGIDYHIFASKDNLGKLEIYLVRNPELSPDHDNLVNTISQVLVFKPQSMELAA